jgi:hypothetical protein
LASQAKVSHRRTKREGGIGASSAMRHV